ncbi:Ran GDP/GTP exchange factor [Rhizophagus clarus]|uniref:Ran GDP/GTP exchange factor n=1 Tax=Rhizophagus clarus TaxID=94130 RepID=A0A8H3L2Y4_9GLOM|nr:Ran GDP/GTP exchange factor [Rhizophagus clarus]
MVKKSPRAKQQVTEPTTDTRRSTRIKGRTAADQASSTNATTAASVKSTTSSRPVRQVRQKKSPQKAATSKSDRPRRNVTTARSTPAASNTPHKRKRKSTSVVNPANQPAGGTTIERRSSKKVKFVLIDPTTSESSTSSRNVDLKQPSTATVQETQVASSVVIHETTVPQVTTTIVPAMKSSKKRSTAGLSAEDSELSTGSTSKRSRKRTVEEDYKLLKPKRRKGDTFTVPIPTRPQQIGQVYVIGSNELSQCDISAGSLHNAALTVDGKIVTWGVNDHGTLGRFTENPKSAEAKAILEAGNYNIIEEGIPAYAEGLDNINIVKVVCGGNATFAISDQGHLYATGTFKGKDGIIGFSYDKRIEQPIFTRYSSFENLTIVDIAAGVDHALALTREGDVYAWGSNEAYRLGRKLSERRSLKPLIPFNLALKHIVRLYAGSYHNFAIDNGGKVWVFGFNNMGQCGLDASKQAIIPPERHSFLNKIGQRVEEFAAGEHHTLARMQNGQVFSFGRSDYGQLGLGDSVLPTSKESKARISTPTAIPSLSSIKSVGAGDHFSMAVDTVNKIYAWGFGDYFVLGNKKEEVVTSPFRMPDLKELEGRDIVRISCGSAHALFLITATSSSDGDAMDVDTNK